MSSPLNQMHPSEGNDKDVKRATETLDDLVAKAIEGIDRNPEFSDTQLMVLIAAGLQRASLSNPYIMELIPGILGLAVVRLARNEIDNREGNNDESSK